jgi:hypothetical protein
VAAAHARDSELHRDALGRRAEDGRAAAMGGANATASAGLSERHQQGDAFARRVAEWLLRQLDDQRFDELHAVHGRSSRPQAGFGRRVRHAAPSTDRPPRSRPTAGAAAASQNEAPRRRMSFGAPDHHEPERLLP